MTPRWSVRVYLALSYALFVLIVFGGSSLFWFARQEQTAEDALRIQLKERARLLSMVSDFDPPQAELFNLPAFYTALDSNLRVIYVTSDLEYRNLSDYTLTSEEQEYIMDLAQEALTGAAISREIYNPNRTEDLYAAAPVYAEDRSVIGAVCLILPLEEFEAAIIGTRNSIIMITLGMAFFSLLLGLLLANWFTRPLAQAQRLSARVANGDYSARLPAKGPRELAELATHLNQMSAELAQQTQERQIVLANLTHELARPLGGLRLGIDSLKAGAVRDPALADDLLNDLGQTIQDMEALLDDLSLAAHPITQSVQLDLQPLAVEPFLRGLKSRFFPRANSQDVRLEVEVPDDLPRVIADELRLSQIMANLLDNAIKYSPRGGQVRLSAERSGSSVVLKVEDQGPGIPPSEMEHIFEPFYQGEQLVRIQHGMGLGLFIAHQLARAHNGALTVENLPWQGLLVKMTLPMAGQQTVE
jgi:signal transduction histidine kinase